MTRGLPIAVMIAGQLLAAAPGLAASPRAPIPVGTWNADTNSDTTVVFAYTDAGSDETPGRQTYGLWLQSRYENGLMLEFGFYPGHINLSTSTAQFGLGAHAGVGFGLPFLSIPLIRRANTYEGPYVPETVDGASDPAGTPTRVDAGASDAGASDAGASDAGASVAGASDAGASDAEASDAEASDAEASDAGASDAGASDAEAPDAEASDAEAPDAGVPDPNSERAHVPTVPGKPILTLVIGAHMQGYVDYQLFDEPSDTYYGVVSVSALGGVAAELRYTPGPFDIRFQLGVDIVGPDQILTDTPATADDVLVCLSGHLFVNWSETNPTPVVVSGALAMGEGGVVDRMVAVGLAF